MAGYIPQRGDFIAVTFNPRSGHEQKGRRPALVISHELFNLFNKHTGLAVVCPITNTDRGFPFHIEITGCPRVTRFVTIEQIRSIDGEESAKCKQQ